MKTILLTLVMTLTGIAHAELSKRELEAKGEEIKTKAKEMKGSQLDDLIRGEQAAVKSYDQVLADLRDPEERKKLEAIRQNHKENVVTLKRYAPPEYRDEAGGAWAGVTQAFTGGAKLISKETAVKALKRGEEHGISEYEEALKDEKLPRELKAKIENELLPQQKQNIRNLKTLL